MQHALRISRYTQDYLVVLLSTKGKKSKVYEYFGDVEADPDSGLDVPPAFNGRNACALCMRDQLLICNVTSYKKGIGSTNLASHLWLHHKVRTIQRDLTLVNPSLKFNLDLLLWCCIDLKPFNATRTAGFMRLLSGVRPDLSPCSPAHLTQNLLPAVYLNFKAHLIAYLNQNFEYGTVMTDIWTDNKLKGKYLTINLVFLNNDFELTKVLLDCLPFKQPHSGVRIAAEIERVLGEFGIAKEKCFFRTDAGSNVVAAMNLGSFKPSKTYAVHGLHNLVTVDCMKNYDPALYNRLNGDEPADEPGDATQQNDSQEPMSIRQDAQDADEEMASLSINNQVNRPNDQHSESEVSASDSDAEEDPPIHLKKLIDKCKKIYNAIKSRHDLLEERYESVLQELAEMWHELDLDERIQFETDYVQLTSIHNSVNTRWNSILRMLLSISKNRQVIHEVLLVIARKASPRDRPKFEALQLTIREINLIDELIVNLEPIEVYTKMICSDNKVIGARFVLGYFQLLKFFKREDDCKFLDEIRLFRALFRSNLPRRVKLEDEDFVQAMLDPNCKQSDLFTGYISKENCSVLLSHHVDLFNGSAAEAAANAEAALLVGGEEQDQQGSVFSMISSLEDEYEVAAPAVVNNSEVVAYLSSARERVDPEAYWKKHNSNSLSKLFRKYGCILNSTATSERTFSRTGMIDQKRRANLLAQNLQAIIFVHENYSICKDSLELVRDPEEPN